MVYDALTESIRLIEGGAVAGAERLSRRRRVLPVAVDVDDDIAVTVFLRRAHHGAEWQSHLLTRTGAGWQLLGGSGSGFDALDVLARAPTAVELGGLARAAGAGGVAVSGVRRPPSGPRWLSHTMIETCAGVGAVEVRGRTIVRPAHGRIAVVWRGATDLAATIIGVKGDALGTLQLRSPTSTYSAPGGLRQGPGSAAESPVEA